MAMNVNVGLNNILLAIHANFKICNLNLHFLQ